MELGESLLQARGPRVAVELGEAPVVRLRVLALGLRERDLPAKAALFALHGLQHLGDLEELGGVAAEREGRRNVQEQEKKQNPQAAFIRAFGSG